MTAQQPLIYVDFDDVLCETARRLMGMFNARFNKSVIFEEIFTFDLNVAFGLDDAQTEALVAAFHDPAVLGALEPITGAVETLRAWQVDGIAVDIVTGRPPSSDVATRDWLRVHGVLFREVIFVDKYGRGHREAPGVELHTCDDLRARGYTLAVDDSFAMAAFLAGRARVPVALYSRPWNLDGDEFAATGGAHIYRCSAWTDIDRVARAVIAGQAETLREDYRCKC